MRFLSILILLSRRLLVLRIEIWFNAHSGPILFPFFYLWLCAARTDRTLLEDARESEPSISNSGCAQPALGPSLSYCLSQFLGPRPPPCSEHSPENLLASQLHPLLNPLQSCFHFTLQGCGGLPPTMPPPHPGSHLPSPPGAPGLGRHTLPPASPP